MKAYSDRFTSDILSAKVKNDGILLKTDHIKDWQILIWIRIISSSEVIYD